MKTFVLISVLIAVSTAGPFKSEGIESLVMGGSNAPASGIPYHVTFRTALLTNFCGGSIINTRWVLSVAQCLDQREASSISVIVGSNTLDAGVTHQGTEIRVRPQYNSITLANDVALLAVTERFVWTDRVQPIALGFDRVQGGVSATFVGWGQTNHLQVVGLTTITNADCTSRLAVAGEDRRVIDTKICTFTRAGQGACSGDLGGPLVTGTNTQIGILSWGVSSCGSGYPDVYSRISSHRGWIMLHAGASP